MNTQAAAGSPLSLNSSSASSSSHQSTANNYTIIKKIGQGTHGVVYLANDKRTETVVAIKAVKRRDRRQDRHRQLLQQSQKRTGRTPIVNNVNTTNETKIRREIALMRRLNHPHVLRLIEVLDDQLEKKIYIVLEYMEGGDIIWRTADHKPVQKTWQAMRITRDVMLGLQYLHHLGIVHRDIKPANLLWSRDRMTVKICDFGVSIYTLATQRFDGPEQTKEDQEFFSLMGDEYLNRLAGTPAFLAAELCFKDDGDEQAPPPAVAENSDPDKVSPKYMIDVWALGVTYYCLLFGHPPWEAGNEWKVYHKIANEDFIIPETMGSDNLPTGGRSPTDAAAFPDGVHVLRILDGLLNKNPCKRLQLREMKRIAYVTRDIPDVDRWQKETDANAGESIQLTEEDTHTAVTSVHWRTKVASGLTRIKTTFSKPGSTPITRSQSVKPVPRRNGSSRPVPEANGSQDSRNADVSRRAAALDPLPSTSGQPLLEVMIPSSSSTPAQLSRTSTNLESHQSTPDSSGVRQKMRGVRGFLKASLPQALRPSLASAHTSTESRSLVQKRLADNHPRHSADSFWAHGDPIVDALSTADVSDSGDINRRRVVSDGDEDQDDSRYDLSSDDYGETENDRVQRLLVGAGGLRSDSSHRLPQSRMDALCSPQRNSTDSYPSVRPHGNAVNSSAGLRERAASPLCHGPDNLDADDEDASSEEEEGETGNHSRRHSVYSGSEVSSSDASSSESEDPVAPVELRLRRLTTSSPDDEGRPVRPTQ